jgi:hypothetical protein
MGAHTLSCNFNAYLNGHNGGTEKMGELFVWDSLYVHYILLYTVNYIARH